ncbi:MAG: TauD/TfdA family dioxygenase [Rhodospirillales bacterium CG15_BIG_FIL_POST_REV_8_21_14_020_66_15]|nr:MAG: TauD/TfdA family dioxygenase [Rhodospirillales bacterium CG15_BIG_FIL_POST_REV_8_21_14_020_66_15]
MHLRTRPLKDTFGLEVLDVDLTNLDDETFDAIYKLWQQEPLLLFRRQSLTEGEHVAYSRRFGDLDILVRDDMLSPKHPEIIYITGLKREDGTPLGGLGSYEVYWHHDQIYRQRPASGSIFYALEMPENDGRTSWCNTKLAYDTLPDDLRQQIEGRRATAKYALKAESSTQRDLAKDAATMKKIHDRTPPAPHDMVLINPVTGEKSIYFDPNKTIAIDGMSEAKTRELVDALTGHILQERFIYTQTWRNGDVMMWDNARLWHRREAFDQTLPRLAKRTTIFLRGKDFAVPEPGLESGAKVA